MREHLTNGISRCNIKCTSATAWNARRRENKETHAMAVIRVRVHSHFGHSEFYRIERPICLSHVYLYTCVARALCPFPPASKWGNAIIFPIRFNSRKIMTDLIIPWVAHAASSYLTSSSSRSRATFCHRTRTLGFNLRRVGTGERKRERRTRAASAR